MKTLSPRKTISLKFATLYIYENYAVSSINEGVVFDTQELEQFQEVFAIYFPNKLFGLIADRENDYTVNPVCYAANNEIKNLVGMAVLCYTEANYETAKFTKPFFNKPLEGFFSFEECITWIKHLLPQ